MNEKNVENSISKEKNYLIDLSNENDDSIDSQYLVTNFCGKVLKTFLEIPITQNNIRIYVIGNIQQIKNEEQRVFIIRELSTNYENIEGENFIETSLGKVPINIHNAGVFYRQFFYNNDYFTRIKSEHEFQNLTESNKQSTALRKGIYLSKVTKTITKDKNEKLNFNLLRCSTNLTGSTDNFRKTDNKIIDSLNETIKFDFEKRAKLNHVLAQIYENKINNGKEVKAKIKAHSDKTKDMPINAIMAFCTFYDKSSFEQLKPSRTDKFDWSYKNNSSGLTRLLFKLKKTVNDDSLVKEFSITLYPNSVFLIPLSTNRLYTHEIRPSVLSIDKIPTRMGYVIRCSNLEAIYMNNQTFIKENGALIKLEQMQNETMKSLRDTYYEENSTEKIVDYGKVRFSMNSGDYEKPIY